MVLKLIARGPLLAAYLTPVFFAPPTDKTLKGGVFVILLQHSLWFVHKWSL